MSEFNWGQPEEPQYHWPEDFDIEEHITNAPRDLRAVIQHARDTMGEYPFTYEHAVMKVAAEQVIDELRGRVEAADTIAERFQQVEVNPGHIATHIALVGVSFFKEVTETDEMDEKIRLKELAKLSVIIGLIASARRYELEGNTELAESCKSRLNDHLDTIGDLNTLYALQEASDKSPAS